MNIICDSLGDRLQGQELDFSDLVGFFQLRLFYDSKFFFSLLLNSFVVL